MKKSVFLQDNLKSSHSNSLHLCWIPFQSENTPIASFSHSLSFFLLLFLPKKTSKTDKKFIFYAERSRKRKKKDSSKFAGIWRRFFLCCYFSSPRTRALTIISLACMRRSNGREKLRGEAKGGEHLRNRNNNKHNTTSTEKKNFTI